MTKGQEIAVKSIGDSNLFESHRTRLAADIDATLAIRDKVIALAVELARKMLGTALFDDTARELLALAEAVKVQA